MTKPPGFKPAAWEHQFDWRKALYAGARATRKTPAIVIKFDPDREPRLNLSYPEGTCYVVVVVTRGA